VTALATLPASPTVLASEDDPGTFVLAALDHAKQWLQQATTTDLPTIVEARARAKAIECYVAQKDLGRDAALAAAEIVRRAERRIGELIREGQAAGEIRRRGQREDRAASHDLPAPTDFASEGELKATDTGIYAMTDGVSAEDFEEAVEEAKAERNLARANVIRKARAVGARRASEEERQPRAVRLRQIRELAGSGYSSPQIASRLGVSVEHVRRLAAEGDIALVADEAIGRARAIDPNRVVQQTVETLEALVSALGLVEHQRLDQDRVADWATSLRRSLRSLQRFTKELTE
jgi:hypothetical protein